MKAFILTFAVLAFSSAQANYIKGQLGLFSLGGETDAGLSSFDHEGEVGSPLMITYGMNYLDNITLEFDLGYWSNDLENTNSSVTSLGVGASAVFHFEPMHQIKPYAAVGAFLGQYEVNNQDDFGLALQAFGGATYAINEQISVGAELRYIMTILDPELGNVEASISNFTVGLVGIYRLPL